MAFVRITDTFSLGTGAPATGTLQVNLRGTSTLATLYSDTTGITTITNPCAITNSVVTACVAEGSYDLIPIIGGVTGTAFPFEAVSGDRLKPTSTIWSSQTQTASSIDSHSSSFTAVAGEIAVCTAGITCGLPASPSVGTEVGVISLSGTVTIQRGGADTLTHQGVSGETAMRVPAGSTVTLKYLSGVWYTARDSRTPASLTAGDWGVDNVSLSASVYTLAPLDTVRFDNSNGAFSTSNHFYTVKYPGTYTISISAWTEDGSQPGNLLTTVTRNGTSPPTNQITNVDAKNQNVALVQDLAFLVSGDIIRQYLWTDTPQTSNIGASMEISRIG